jgi:hypothetical protein
MNTRELDTQPAGFYARAAALDAQRSNRENMLRWTAAQLAKAQTAVDLLHTAFNYDHLYVNYRKRWISIKLVNGRARSRALRDQVETIFADQGYKRVITAQGTSYRLFSQ